MKHKCLITVIRRSCLTGRAVWIYRGPSKDAAYRMYRRACRREVERVRRWSSITAIRMQNITRLLNDCMDKLPFTTELTSQQQESAKTLQKISKQPLCSSEFYEHILEEQRRKKEKSRNYDK